MHPGLKGLLWGTGGLAYVVLAFLWFDAEAEVRILCGFIRPGMTLERATEALDTGNYLRYSRNPDGGQDLRVSSPWTAHTSRCAVEVSDGMVTASRYRSVLPLERIAGGVAGTGLFLLTLFHLLLASGAPLGILAWGGRHRVLPPGLRLASLVSALVVAAGGVLVLTRSKLMVVPGLPPVAVDLGVGFLAFLFLASAVANALGAGEEERRWGLPAALVLAASCIVVSFGP